MNMSWDRACCMSTTSSSIDSGASSASAFSPSSLPRDYDVVLPSSSSSSSSSSSVFFFPSSDYIDDQSTREHEESNTTLAAPLTLPLLHHYHLHSSAYSTRSQIPEICSCHHQNHLSTSLTSSEINSTFVYEQYLTSFKSEQSEYLPYLFDNVVYPQPCSPPSPTNDSITYYQLDQVQNNSLTNKIPTRSQHLVRTIQPIIYQQLSSIEPASSNSQQQLPIVKRLYSDTTQSTTTMTSTTPVPTITNSNDSSTLPYARLDSPSFGTYDIWRERTVVGRKNTRRPVDVNMGATAVVSRIHFEILLINGTEFHLKCLSKNGIFINNQYTSMAASNLLPKQCTLRFPSTDLCISFSSLLTTSNSNHRLSIDSLPERRSLSSVLAESNHSSSPMTSSQQQVILVTNNESTNVNGYPSSSLSMNNHSIPMKFFDENSTSIHLGPTDATSPKQEPIEISATIDMSAFESELNGLKNSTKPPFSYAQLIVQAISSAPDKQMTLSQIYNFISAQYPYYESNNRGWQNSIRHNLSLNRYFIRSARKENDCGKGSFWRLDQKCEEKLIDHAFRHRKQRTNQLQTMSSSVTIKNEFDEVPSSPTEQLPNDGGEFLLADLHMSNSSTPISPMISPSPSRSNDDLKRKRSDDDDDDEDDDETIRRQIRDLLNSLTESIDTDDL